MSKKKPFDFIKVDEDRMGLFLSNNSFDLEKMYGRNYLKSDVIHKVKIYKIDIVNSKKHDLYNQSEPDEKVFFPPIEIFIMPLIESNEQNNYAGDIGIIREDSQSFNFGVYLDELKEKNVEIDRGDIVEYNLSGDRRRFYEVDNAQNVTTTENTFGGFLTYWKLIKTVPVKSDVIPLLNDDKFR